MGCLRRRFYLLCGVLALTACALDDRYGDPASGYPADSDTRLAGVDWSKAEQVTIRLSEFEFTPETPVFRVGRPYVLVLANDGRAAHTFTAEAFFRAVAVYGLGFANGEDRQPTLNAVAVDAGETRTLHFMPVTAGTYDLTCERLFHEIFGMSGTIRIE